jgi:hypothetical protein
LPAFGDYVLGTDLSDSDFDFLALNRWTNTWSYFCDFFHNLETMPLTCNEKKNAKIRPTTRRLNYTMKPGWIGQQ